MLDHILGACTVLLFNMVFYWIGAIFCWITIPIFLLSSLFNHHFGWLDSFLSFEITSFCESLSPSVCMVSFPFSYLCDWCARVLILVCLCSLSSFQVSFDVMWLPSQIHLLYCHPEFLYCNFADFYSVCTTPFAGLPILEEGSLLWCSSWGFFDFFLQGVFFWEFYLIQYEGLRTEGVVVVVICCLWAGLVISWSRNQKAPDTTGSSVWTFIDP